MKMGLKFGFILTVLVATLVSLAEAKDRKVKFDLPTAGAAQEQFKTFLNEGDFKQALAQWTQSYAGTSFGASASGQAIYSYVLFKNGLENLALERLFAINDPSAIASDVRKLWMETATPLHPVWKTSDLKWRSSLISFFQTIHNSESVTYPVYSVESKSQLGTLKKQIANRGGDEHQKAWHAFQQALWSGYYDENAAAIGAFDVLTAKENLRGVDIDRVWLNKARVHFQAREFEEALDAYNQVSKGSDYWLEAVEEKGWTFLRMDRPEKTLAQVKTLMAPMLKTQVGPEPYFMAALTNLKVCDYPAIFEIIDQFKKNFKDRIGEISKLAQEGSTPAAEAAVEKLAKGPFRLKTVAKELPFLPRLFNRDQYIRGNIERYGAYRNEAAQASSLIASGLLNENLADLANRRAEVARVAVYKRLKYLAEWEVAEAKDIIQKLHIVEAEVIQRIHRNQKLSNKRLKERGEKVARTSDVLVFPVTSETWFDELDSYHVRVKDCPPLGGKAL